MSNRAQVDQKPQFINFEAQVIITKRDFDCLIGLSSILVKNYSQNYQIFKELFKAEPKNSVQHFDMLQRLFSNLKSEQKEDAQVEFDILKCEFQADQDIRKLGGFSHPDPTPAIANTVNSSGPRSNPRSDDAEAKSELPISKSINTAPQPEKLIVDQLTCDNTAGGLAEVNGLFKDLKGVKDPKNLPNPTKTQDNSGWTGAGLFNSLSQSSIFSKVPTTTAASSDFDAKLAFAPSGGLFGTLPAGPPASSTFGTKAKATPPSSIFSPKPTATTTGDMFRPKPTATPTGGLFSSQPTATPQSNIFSPYPTATTTADMFRPKPTATPQSNIFSPNPTATTAGSLFSSLSTATPQSNMFRPNPTATTTADMFRPKPTATTTGPAATPGETKQRGLFG